MTRIDNARVIRAPRGTELSARSWMTEAPLRMLMNNLDPAVAERPDDLVVYGGRGVALGQQPIATRHVDLAVQHNAGSVTGRHQAGNAGMVQHLGHDG